MLPEALEPQRAELFLGAVPSRKEVAFSCLSVGPAVHLLYLLSTLLQVGGREDCSRQKPRTDLLPSCVSSSPKVTASVLGVPKPRLPLRGPKATTPPPRRSFSSSVPSGSFLSRDLSLLPSGLPLFQVRKSQMCF